MILPGAQIVQMAWLVDDLEAAATRLSSAMRCGPFLMNRNIQLTEPIHRGKPQRTDFSLALAQAGEVQVELVQQHDATASVYRDMFPDGPPGGMAFHHVAVMVDDVAAETRRYNALGFETASSGRFGDVDFTYVDTCLAGGFMVEVLPRSETIRRFFGAVRRAAENWDETTPWVEMA